jgi:hypothetical protein
MIIIQTKVAKTIRDERYKPIMEAIIYLKTMSIVIDNNNATVNAIYYYKDVDGNDVLLTNTSVMFTKEQVRAIQTRFPKIDTEDLFDAIDQRILEFTKMLLQMQSGDNFGILYSEWDFSQGNTEL